MPSRWWLPVHNIDPRGVKLEHLHAVVCRWLDISEADHQELVKPYALSPLTSASSDLSDLGFEVATLTSTAERRLLAAIRPGTPIRLGAQVGRLGKPSRLLAETWESLATPSGASAWELQFLTPAGFRSGQRWSPWPAPAAVLRGLSQSWNRWSGLPARAPSHAEVDRVWVCEVDGRSEPLTLGAKPAVGFLGTVAYRAEQPAVANLVDGLFRLALFAGVGSAKAKGLGVTVVRTASAQVARRPRTG